MIKYPHIGGDSDPNKREVNMKTLLQIKSSIFSDGGQSSRLAERFVAAWRESNPGGRVIVRDLARDPVPHLDAARFSAFLAKPEERTPEQRAVVDYSDTLIGELKRADVLIAEHRVHREAVAHPMSFVPAVNAAYVLHGDSLCHRSEHGDI